MLGDHPLQELETIVEVPLAEADGVVAEPAGLASQELGLVLVAPVAVAEEIARVDRQDVPALVPDLVEDGGPPGQSAVALAPSATGLDMALDVAGIEDRERDPGLVAALSGGRLYGGHGDQAQAETEDEGDQGARPASGCLLHPGTYRIGGES
jgi:hypothetical protein